MAGLLMCENLNLKNRILKIAYGILTIGLSNLMRQIKMYKYRKYDDLPHPFRIIFVNPKNITHIAGKFNSNPWKYGGEFSTAYFSGAEIRSGNWDTKKKPISTSKKYQAVKGRYVDGKSWEETGIYHHILDKIDKYGSYDGCNNKKELVKRYENIDNIYKDIHENGFRVEDSLDHICVNISRNGEILFNGNGNHRLFISKILDVEKIPVRIIARHKKWQKIRKKALDSKRDVSINVRNHPDINNHTTISV